MAVYVPPGYRTPMAHQCQNCRSTDELTWSITVGDDQPSTVYLCEGCTDAFDREFVWGAAATN
jgi:hypothetical protein